MTFSDRAVRSLLNRRFVCARTNTEGDPEAGASFAHEPGSPAGTCVRGNGEHNIQLVTLTPEGRIVHVLAGYVAPRDLEEELRFALSTFASLADEGALTPEQRVAAAHEDFVEALEQRRFDGPLAEWARRRALADHRFMVRHPLLPVDRFRPAMLVGNARTFFGSSAGGAPRERIGDDEALDPAEAAGRKTPAEILDELRKRGPSGLRDEEAPEDDSDTGETAR